MKLPRCLIEFTGHTMLTKYPPFVIYRPDIHRVRGPQVRQILDIVHKGDILLRRYDGYLNTIFTPGFWGHAGIYVGFNQTAHAVGTGTEIEDVLNFCRCDAICILEVVGLPDKEREIAVQAAIDIASKNIEYDFNFNADNETYYCTEFVDVAYNGIFYNDYQEIAGNLVLTPDGIRHSKQVKVKLEIKP